MVESKDGGGAAWLLTSDGKPFAIERSWDAASMRLRGLGFKVRSE